MLTTCYVKIPLLIKGNTILSGYPVDLKHKMNEDKLYSLWRDFMPGPSKNVLASDLEAGMSAYSRVKNRSGEGQNIGKKREPWYQNEDTTTAQVKIKDSEQGLGQIGEWVQVNT